MLVLTIQKREVAQKIMNGEYVGDFWKSDYSCLSPEYTAGYRLMREKLNAISKRPLADTESPIWAWVGTPFIEFHKGTNEDNLVAMFLDIPKDEMIFSDYDAYVDFVEGKTKSARFLIPKEEIEIAEVEGRCIQACISSVKPEQVVLTAAFSCLKDSNSKSVMDFFRYWRIVVLYQLLTEKAAGLRKRK